MTTRLSEAINSQADGLEGVAERDLAPWAERLAGCRRLWLVGTGSSQHCAELGALIFQEAGLDARWASSAQFVRWLPPPRTDDGVIVISHTGRTAFAAAARQRALDCGVAVASITGIGSGWAEAFETVPQERSETHTVSYTAALLALVRLAAELGASGPKAGEISASSSESETSPPAARRSNSPPLPACSLSPAPGPARSPRARER